MSKAMTWKEFTKLYGTNTTNNFQLEKYAKELGIKNFYCLMRNELNQLKSDDPINVIINLHKSNQKGIHWSLVFTDKFKAYFFDSYGLPPTQEVVIFLEKFNSRCYSTFKLQNFNESYCGQLCLFILDKLNKGFSFYDIILSLKNIQ